MAVLVVATICFPAAGSAAVKLQKIGDFNAPVDVAQPRGANGLLFVVEDVGTVAVLRGGTELDHKFLDISDLVDCGCGEQGLKSIAFDPGYRNNRRFYVLYTNRDGNTEVDMFERSPGSATRADESSRRQVIVIPLGPVADHFRGTHQGDQLQFGPDGHLYVSVGDGGCCYDPADQAQNLDDLHGKVLRIDPQPAGGYTIPNDNPLVGKPGLDEIFAWGFRNPWRFSFDRNRIAIGDVGEFAQEEIDYNTIPQANGANFGWPEYEGTLLDDPSRPGPGPPVAPILVYPHGPACAVTGGYVVRDRTLGSLYGRYVYGDYCTGELRSFKPKLGNAADDQPLGLTVPSPSSFGRGSDGRIYVASWLGAAYRLAPAGGPTGR